MSPPFSWAFRPVRHFSVRTIYESFIRKYTALSGMSSDLIRSSHKFTPVTIGQSLRLNGASFNFFYTLHSIPCIGFEVRRGREKESDIEREHERVRRNGGQQNLEQNTVRFGFTLEGSPTRIPMGWYKEHRGCTARTFSAARRQCDWLASAGK